MKEKIKQFKTELGTEKKVSENEFKKTEELYDKNEKTIIQLSQNLNSNPKLISELKMEKNDLEIEAELIEDLHSEQENLYKKIINLSSKIKEYENEFESEEEKFKTGIKKNKEHKNENHEKIETMKNEIKKKKKLLNHNEGKGLSKLRS